MLLATSNQIKQIDERAADVLGVSTYELIGRAGNAIASVVKEYTTVGDKIVILAGKGNNGADGYAAARILACDYNVVVYDVFATGQKGNDGKCYRDEFVSQGGVVKPYCDAFALTTDVSDATCILDAIFGIGVSGELPMFLADVASVIRGAAHTAKIAVDIPLGVISDSGRVDERFIYAADATVSLCLLKPCNVSYPAKQYMGKLIYDNISLQIDAIMPSDEFQNFLVDNDEAIKLLPMRDDNSNKGSFGKMLMITGSSEYPGAGRLTLESALRGGVGLVTYLGEKEQNDALLRDFPEVIYKERKAFSELSDSDISNIIELSRKHKSVLIGSGCGRSTGLLKLLKALIASYNGNLILDADAINVLSDEREESLSLLSGSKANITITPHPLEFARLLGISVDQVNAARIDLARSFSREYGCITVLKGAATVTTDGDAVYVNYSGSSALAKAGSGDALAGFLASLSTSADLQLSSSALAVYIHGKAADELAKTLSHFGVTPSDLPRQMAREITKMQT